MPPEDVRESRLRSVIKRHCHSAKGFSWEALLQKKKKKTLLLVTCSHAHPDTSRGPQTRLSPQRKPMSQTLSHQMKRDESGELQFPADCGHPMKMTL